YNLSYFLLYFLSHFRWSRCGHYFTLVVRLNASPPLLDQSMSSSRATPDFAHLTSARRLQLRRFRMPETEFSSASISALKTSGPELRPVPRQPGHGRAATSNISSSRHTEFCNPLP